MYIHIVVCAEPFLQLILAVSTPHDRTMKNTVVLKAIRKSADIYSTSFPIFINSHLNFFVLLNKDCRSCKCIDILLALTEINTLCLFQNEMLMLIPVIFIITKSKSMLFFNSKYICKLEETSLELMSCRLTYTNDTTAVVNKLSDSLNDVWIYPPVSTCMCCISIPHIDKNINVI